MAIKINIYKCKYKTVKQMLISKCIYTSYAKTQKEYKSNKKKQYYTDKFKQVQKDLKTTWKLTNKIILYVINLLKTIAH